MPLKECVALNAPLALAPNVPAKVAPKRLKVCPVAGIPE